MCPEKRWMFVSAIRCFLSWIVHAKLPRMCMMYCHLGTVQLLMREIRIPVKLTVDLSSSAASICGAQTEVRLLFLAILSEHGAGIGNFVNVDVVADIFDMSHQKCPRPR